MRGWLLTLAYYAFPRLYQFEERRWNYLSTFSYTNPTWNKPGANTGLRVERLSTNDLSHGTVYSYLIKHCMRVGVCHLP
jgi:hypothetical protein